MTTQEKKRLHQQKWLSKPGNKERQAERVRAWKQAHKIETRLYKKAWLTKARDTKIVKRLNKQDIGNWSSKICGICLEVIVSDFHIDHIIPLSRGGTHTVENLQLAHPYCNRSKFTKLPEEMKVV